MEKNKETKKMAELRALAEAKCAEYNKIMLESKIDVAAKEKVEKELEDTVNEYTALARTAAFDECAATQDAMHEACRRLVYSTIKKVDVKPDSESKTTRREIEDTTKVIDLGKLNKHVKDGIGQDHDWIYAVEKMNLLLCAGVAEKLGIDPTEIHNSFAMRQISREYNLGKNAVGTKKDPISKTNLLKTLNRIIYMMLGEGYKATSHDVNYLLFIYTKKSPAALRTTCANHSTFRNYIQEICHRIINDLPYGIDYKKAKV